MLPPLSPLKLAKGLAGAGGALGAPPVIPLKLAKGLPVGWAEKLALDPLSELLQSVFIWSLSEVYF